MLKYLYTSTIALLCALLISLPMTGCTVSQAKINTVVTNIQSWTPTLVTAATALLLDVAAFDTNDATQIESYITIIKTDSSLLTTLTATYLATPDSTTLAKISSTISDMSTNDADALMAVLQIKNSTSQTTAKGILTTISTALTILSAYLSSINVSTTSSASLKVMKPYVDTNKVTKELQKSKDQGLISNSVSLQQFGF